MKYLFYASGLEWKYCITVIEVIGTYINPLRSILFFWKTMNDNLMANSDKLSLRGFIVKLGTCVNWLNINFYRLWTDRSSWEDIVSTVRKVLSQG